MALELASSIAPPTPCSSRITISHHAAAGPSACATSPAAQGSNSCLMTTNVTGGPIPVRQVVPSPLPGASAELREREDVAVRIGEPGHLVASGGRPDAVVVLVHAVVADE